MKTFVTDVGDTLVHVGGKPDGKPRSHTVTAVKLLLRSGWQGKVWSHAGEEHAREVVGKLGLKIDTSQCYQKPELPFTPARVKAALGSIPDLQFDDLESQAIPGVAFVHTPREGNVPMCCQDGMTRAQHRSETSDNRCCTDHPPTEDTAG